MLSEVAEGISFLTKDIGFCRFPIGGSVRCLETFTSSMLLLLISKLLVRMIETGVLLLDSGAGCEYSRPAKREGDDVRAFFHAGGNNDIDGTFARLLFGDCEL